MKHFTMPAEAGSTAIDEWRQGWPVVVASAVGFGVAMLYFYSLGIMIAPIGAEFGWSRTQISTGPAIVAALNFLLTAAVGRLVDRVGSRRVALPGYVAYCLSICALGLATSNILSWYALWTLLGICYLFTSGSIWALSVASRFDTSRGLALAVALSGTGVAASLAPTLGGSLLPILGWRGVYLIFGFGSLVLGLPILFKFLYSSHDIKFRRLVTDQEIDIRPPSRGLTFKEAISGRSFWIFAICSILIGTGFGGLLIHFVPMAIQRGIAPETAARAAGLVGVAAIAGRFATGFMMDHLPGRKVGAALFLLPACTSTLLFVGDTSLGTTMVSAIALGLAVGAEYDVLAVLVSRYVGMRSYAAIYGQIIAIFGIGIGIGPPLAGLIYDRYGSYDPLLLSLIAVFIVPPLLLSFLGDAPNWDNK